MPPLAAILAIATLFWALWAFANFVAELHGFRNPIVVLGAVVADGDRAVLRHGDAASRSSGITPQEVA